jgi:hypothetical protein
VTVQVGLARMRDGRTPTVDTALKASVDFSNAVSSWLGKQDQDDGTVVPDSTPVTPHVKRIVMGDNKQQSSNGASTSRYMVSAEGKSSSIRLMTPNQFYKVCPTKGSAGFGPPMCGDGTPFCFYVSRSRSNTDKLLVEIMGGGACWDEETCNGRSELLTFPTQFDGFLGLSCSEIQVLGIEANGMPINMLCAGTLGETDLSQYNSIM